MYHTMMRDGYDCENPKRGYYARRHDGIRYYNKTILHWSMCYIHNRVYYYHGLVRGYSYINNFFLDRQNYMALRSVGWCIFLPALHSFICLTRFLSLFSFCCIETTLFHSFCLLWLKLLPCLVVIVSLIAMMTSLPYISDVMTIFVLVTGVLKGCDLMQNILPWNDHSYFGFFPWGFPGSSSLSGIQFVKILRWIF